jgi:hypothetical protein
MAELFRKIGRKVEETLSLDQEIVLFCAFRYALGRKTYVVSSVCNELMRVEHLLPWDFKYRTVKEIQEHQDEFGEAGMACDNDEWEYIKCLFDKDRRCKIEANLYKTDNWVEVEAFLHTNGNYYPVGYNPTYSMYHTTRKK